MADVFLKHITSEQGNTNQNNALLPHTVRQHKRQSKQVLMMAQRDWDSWAPLVGL